MDTTEGMVIFFGNLPMRVKSPTEGGERQYLLAISSLKSESPLRRVNLEDLPGASLIESEVPALRGMLTWPGNRRCLRLVLDLPNDANLLDYVKAVRGNLLNQLAEMENI
jgi:hypothetical protein